MGIELVIKPSTRPIGSRQPSHPGSNGPNVASSPRVRDIESPESDLLIKEAKGDSELESLLSHPDSKVLGTSTPVKSLPEHKPTGSWLVPAWVAALDGMASGAIHILTCGCLDYLFFPGAKLFGSRGMFLTILLTIPIVRLQGMYFIAICSLVTVVLVVAMKRFFRRPRPVLEALGEKQFSLRKALKSYSFPSGDSAQAGSFAMSMYLLTGEKMWGAVSVPIAVWGRVYFGCHYISDCICGTLLGLLMPWMLWEILSRPMFSITMLNS